MSDAEVLGLVTVVALLAFWCIVRWSREEFAELQKKIDDADERVRRANAAIAEIEKGEK